MIDVRLSPPREIGGGGSYRKTGETKILGECVPTGSCVDRTIQQRRYGEMIALLTALAHLPFDGRVDIVIRGEITSVHGCMNAWDIETELFLDAVLAELESTAHALAHVYPECIAHINFAFYPKATPIPAS